MKADFTRLTFDRAKHYRAVQQQQGRVQLDSDWNEQNDLTSHRIETETKDTVGHCGAPINFDGFRIYATAAELTAAEQARPGNAAPPNPAAGDLLITAGRFYNHGVLTENETICLVSAQPEYPTPAEITKVGQTPLFPLPAPGTYLAYLDVWPRFRNSIDDRAIREVALNGVDTATRAKNSWQVKFLPAASGANCATPNAQWDALINRVPGTLAAAIATSASKNSPCIVDPGSSYRRLENQLYRVEVHNGGASLAQATFKWSRDNGSIVTRWISKQILSDEIEVETTGRDKVLNIAPGHWVELTDDIHEELGLPGTLATVTKVVGNRITIDSANATGPVEFTDFPRNPRIRRWDAVSTNAGKWSAPGGEKNLNTTNQFELEDGVVVQFGVGDFRTGDYWLIPARTASPYVEWPLSPANKPALLPPHGIPHFYCKLAVVEFTAPGFKIVDCRNLFPPLTELTSVFYISGESQEATPNPTQPGNSLPLKHPLCIGVANGEWPVAGARIRFTIKTAGGSLAPLGAGGVVINPATVDAITDAEGIARCNWSLDSTTTNPEVSAELLDSSNTRIHLPIIFHARLNSAQLVSYDPAACEDMKNHVPPIVNVQDAIDFLCAHHEAQADCCVTIGEYNGNVGDYKTISDAVHDLLVKRRLTSICLNLFPGDHIVEELAIGPVDDSRPFVKIDGCGHASRLVLRGPLIFRKLSAAVIRDVSIRIEKGEIRFEGNIEVELSRLIVNGQSDNNSLLRFGNNEKVTLSENSIRVTSRQPNTFSPARLFERVPILAAPFANIEEAEFQRASQALMASLANTPPAERQRMVEQVAATLQTVTEIPAVERRAYSVFLEALAAPGFNAAVILQRLSAIRVIAAAAVSPGFAFAFLDYIGVIILTANQINGIGCFGGEPTAQPFIADDLKRMKAAGLRFNPQGSLQLHGNRFLQLSANASSVEILRAVANGNSQPVPAYATGLCSDNVIELGQNFFMASHLSLSVTRFVQSRQDYGVAISNTATFVANSGDNEARLFNCAARASQLTANIILNIVTI